MLSFQPAPSASALLALFCSFEGRIARVPYWAGSIAIAVLLGFLEVAARRWIGLQVSPWLLLPNAIAMFPLAALAGKRAADRGRSPYWGVILVLFTVGSGLLAGVATLTPSHALAQLSAGMKVASTLAWLVLFIDLGLMPSRPAIAPRRYREAA